MNEYEYEDEDENDHLPIYMSMISGDIAPGFTVKYIFFNSKDLS